MTWQRNALWKYISENAKIQNMRYCSTNYQSEQSILSITNLSTAAKQWKNDLYKNLYKFSCMVYFTNIVMSVRCGSYRRFHDKTSPMKILYFRDIELLNFEPSCKIRKFPDQTEFLGIMYLKVLSRSAKSFIHQYLCFQYASFRFTSLRTKRIFKHNKLKPTNVWHVKRLIVIVSSKPEKQSKKASLWRTHTDVVI